MSASSLSVVTTDASNYELAAVLQHQHGSQLKTTVLVSSSDTDADRRYSSGGNKALVFLWACEK